MYLVIEGNLMFPLRRQRRETTATRAVREHHPNLYEEAAIVEQLRQGPVDQRAPELVQCIQRCGQGVFGNDFILDRTWANLEDEGRTAWAAVTPVRGKMWEDRDGRVQDPSTHPMMEKGDRLLPRAFRHVRWEKERVIGILGVAHGSRVREGKIDHYAVMEMVASEKCVRLYDSMACEVMEPHFSHWAEAVLREVQAAGHEDVWGGKWDEWHLERAQDYPIQGEGSNDCMFRSIQAARGVAAGTIPGGGRLGDGARLPEATGARDMGSSNARGKDSGSRVGEERLRARRCTRGLRERRVAKGRVNRQ